MRIGGAVVRADEGEIGISIVAHSLELALLDMLKVFALVALRRRKGCGERGRLGQDTFATTALMV